MYLVGKCQPHNQRLVKITQECLYKAIKVVKPGAYLGDIGHAIQQHAESNYYSVVEEYCGHGIGNVYHEEPQILHYGKPGRGIQIQEGMCFTIEPMINQGSKYCKTFKTDGLLKLKMEEILLNGNIHLQLHQTEWRFLQKDKKNLYDQK